jgi:AcrR family transcriptional regulator
MVHYYFGSKKTLLAAVLERAFEPLANAIAAMGAQDDPNVEKFVSLIFEIMREHPNLPLLLMRQVLLPGSPMQAHFLERLAPRLGGALPGIIKKGQATGRIDTNLQPTFAALMILSLCVFPFISKPLSQPALGIDFDAGGMDELQRHITRFVHGGLQAT